MEGSSSAAKEGKWIKYYCNFHKILLVGEGDFSFSVSLANAFGSASNIVATSLDSEVEVKATYSKGETNLKVLKEMGCTIIHQVDVHTMMDNSSLVEIGPFDRIIFNFPHAPLLYRERDFLQIQLHQGLVRGFMKNALAMLSVHGEVHVTHKTTYPFSNWGIEVLAKEVGLLCLTWIDTFNIREYPGYENKRGYSNRIWTCDDSFPIGECSTFRFARVSTVLQTRHGIYVAKRLCCTQRRAREEGKNLLYDSNGFMEMEPIICFCGEFALVKVCWKQVNYGRRFFGCPNYRGDKYCGYFSWVDDMVNLQNRDATGIRREDGRDRVRVQRGITVGCGLIIFMLGVVVGICIA